MDPAFVWSKPEGQPKLRNGATRFLAYMVSHQELVSGTPGSEIDPPVYDTVKFYDFQPPPTERSDHGTGEWAIWLLLPYIDHPKAGVKDTRQKIKDWIDSPANVGPLNGRPLAKGPWTPKRFEAQAPSAVWDAVTDGGAVQHVIFGQDPVALGQLDDGDLD
jgi:hypothetical protein